jgi:hypothetical protein
MTTAPSRHRIAVTLLTATAALGLVLLWLRPRAHERPSEAPPDSSSPPLEIAPAHPPLPLALPVLHAHDAAETVPDAMRADGGEPRVDVAQRETAQREETARLVAEIATRVEALEQEVRGLEARGDADLAQRRRILLERQRARLRELRALLEGDAGG